jgi:hypothetical protein
MIPNPDRSPSVSSLLDPQPNQSPTIDESAPKPLKPADPPAPLPVADDIAASPTIDEQQEKTVQKGEPTKADGPTVIDEETPTPQQGKTPAYSGKVNPRVGTLTVNWLNDIDPDGDGDLRQVRAAWAELSPEAKEVLRREVRRLTQMMPPA